MDAIILDTETHTLNGLPIEIAYASCSVKSGALKVSKKIFDEYYSIGDIPIDCSAMAIHHIIDADIKDKPHYTTFSLPEGVKYIIGHNIDYDLKAISQCGIDTRNIKKICTLALARHLWPNLSSHTLGSLVYQFTNDAEQARKLVKNAHNAAVDISLTAIVLEEIMRKCECKNMNDLYNLNRKTNAWTKMYYGKHKGKKISDLPVDYVKWLVSQPDLNAGLKEGLSAYHPSFKHDLFSSLPPLS